MVLSVSDTSPLLCFSSSLERCVGPIPVRLRGFHSSMETSRVSRAQGSHVTKADLQASNAIIHVIDRVIYPFPTLSIPLILTFDMDLNNLGYLSSLKPT
ncbi:hypothetical protein ElyMa_003004100 [Elysia marginata]|uniref:FAS1 domain-containing protein n=1 Tax=Elysia marginata TaxID=1093978 RepID=A0AAV4IH70_9GAST|nr:hypothetical protein ElyMa_003004100 [Elysia marginata]